MVEFISPSSEMPAGQKPNPVIVVVDKNDSAVVQHYPVRQFQLNDGGSEIHKSAQAMHMRLPRQLTLRTDMTRDSTTGTARCFFGISGYIGKQAKARAQFPSLQLVDIWGRAAERDWPRRP